jgi:hypothetical protein
MGSSRRYRTVCSTIARTSSVTGEVIVAMNLTPCPGPVGARLRTVPKMLAPTAKRISLSRCS